MKVLIHSNAPWAPTGYGSQVNLFAEALNEHHELSLSAFYGLEGSRLAWNGIQIYPGVGGEYGNLSLVPHAKHAFGNPRGGLVFTLLDVWVLDHAVCQQLNMASWVPVDHDPCPPRVAEFFQASAAVPVAMSRFGQERLSDFDPLYIPHGVDVEVFKPMDQAKAREATKLDKDAFVVGVVGANKGRPSRKSFQQSLEAFRFFRERHEDAVLYLHTTLDGQFTQGEDLNALIESLEIPTESLRVANQYRLAFNPLPSEGMARLYSSFDVLLNPSQGEGFGIPIIEAQACGVPAIVTDHSAMPEVCGAGWHVPGRPHWTGQKSWQAIPDVAAIVGALEERYEMTDEEREAQDAAARAHALNYSREVVLRDHFLPALDELAERFGEVPEAVAA